jgi:hypothetical protein
MYPQGRRPLALILLTLLIAGSAFAYSFDDDIPEINDPVARLTYVDGNVQVRRADSDEWERAVTNLPIVEGDEIVTDENGRFEIQFSINKYLRADERTSVRIVTLKEDGIAISVAQGNANIRLLEFDTAKEFFEIDAPQSTIALQSKGRYRIDAGEPGESSVRISVFDQGEARVYSSTSGFTLISGRTAKVFTAGRLSGEWELGDTDIFADSFDDWALRRDESIAANLRNAHYGRYYDTDIYGADELDDHGDWIYTRDYGYVWRPSTSAISSYSDWSPYRYGQWRWIPPYGWTWVNDEPWGWATYHYGRWIWYNGYWHWTPYGYDRYSRSWWRPALVVFTTNRNNYCWYPLPYYSPYYNYNYHYYSRNRRPRGGGWGGNQNPAPAPTPAQPGKVSGRVPANTPILTPEQRRARMTTPPLQNIPPTGVVTVGKDEFGTGRGVNRRPPLATAREVLSKPPVETETPPILPQYEEVSKKMGREVRAERPVRPAETPVAKTGATTRTDNAPLDNRLRTTRMLGNRPPLEINTPQGDVKTAPVGTPGRPRTGAVDRPVNQSPPLIIRPENGETKQRVERPVENKRRDVPSFPQQAPRRDAERTAPVPQPREEPQRVDPPRRAQPPLQRSEPRYDPPVRRSEPPQRSEPPKERAPAPRNDPPRKSDPPPKSDPPKRDPAPPLERKKDGV